MKAGFALLRLTRGDLLERTRSYGYLVTLAVTLYAAYVFIPPNGSSYSTVSIGGHRGIYNSAWIGTIVAMLTNAFLSLAGFYLVKNSIRRDITTRVGQIIASSRVSTFRYLLAKWLSNLAVLASIVFVLGVVAIVMQLLRGEDTNLHLLPLAAPFLYITLPMMAAVSALAIAFESVALLRGGLGNVVFFFLWTAALGSAESTGIDILGFQTSIESMQAATARAYPDYDPVKGGMNIGFNFKDSGEAYQLSTFVWPGIDWGSENVFRRSGWIAVSVLIVGASSLAFRRFDEVSGGTRFRRKKKNIPAVAGVEAKGTNGGEEIVERNALLSSPGDKRGTDIVPANESANLNGGLNGGNIGQGRGNFSKILRAELFLMLKGISKWWIIVAGTLIVLGLTLPITAVRQFIFPLTVIWPILRWSPLGSRELTHRTEQLIFSCPHPVRYQFAALWSAGVILAVVTGSGIGARFLVAGDWESVFGWSVGMMFIPSLAIACGVWTGSAKLFEIVYLILWYIGPMNKFPALDYLSSSAKALESGMPVMFLIVTIILIGFAVTGRVRQLARL